MPRLAAALLLATLACGCSPPATESSTATAAGPEETVAMARPASVSVPSDLLAGVREDCASSYGLAPEALTVVRAEAVTWRDGALGCPQPGVAYTQALVEGYWVVLAADGRRFDYRASSNGRFGECRSPDRQPPLPRGQAGRAPDAT